MTSDMCMMQAIASDGKKQLPVDRIDNTTSSSSSIPSAESARRIRQFWHQISAKSAEQSRARMLVEEMLEKTAQCMGQNSSNMTMGSDSMEVMLDFAQCDDPTDRFDCSSPSVFIYRTIDGTCNNIDYPLWGAANTAFTRLSPAVYEDGIQQPVGYNQQVNDNPFIGPWPSAREVSRRIVRDMPSRAPLSHIIAFWSQMVAHDLTLTGEFATSACEQSCDAKAFKSFCYPIPVYPIDPSFGTHTQNKGQCLLLTRSVAECIKPSGNESVNLARQQLNQNTHFLDGSAVYGSIDEEAALLRSFRCGRLKTTAQTISNGGHPPFLPFDQSSDLPLFAFGDFRGNSFVPLMVIQTVLIREHNQLVRELSAINPCWDDETLYQEARAIVTAKIQIITYEEMLPAIYGSTYEKYIGDYTGYDPTVKAVLTNEFATAGLRFGHSLLSDSFLRLDSDNNPLPIGPLGLHDSFLNTLQYYISGGTDPLLRGSLQDQSRAIDEFVNRVFTTQLFARVRGVGQDIASRDIQRGRDHGLPSYRHYEKFCKEIFGETGRFDLKLNNMLRQVYGAVGHRDGIDLWVGMLGEDHLEGAQIGPTTACLMAFTFRDIRSGDRFWWNNSFTSGGPFTEEQRVSLSGTLLSKMICDNADDIPFIKHHAFLSGGDPVDCSSLPSLDLTLWKDDSCADKPAINKACVPPHLLL